jgi:hypothetical protein
MWFTLSSSLPIWRDVNEMLPDITRTYLVFIEELNDLWTSEYVDIAMYDPDYGWFQKAHKITHWMPLPKSPKDHIWKF